jgi:hypothetical protein
MISLEYNQVELFKTKRYTGTKYKFQETTNFFLFDSSRSEQAYLEYLDKVGGYVRMPRVKRVRNRNRKVPKNIFS